MLDSRRPHGRRHCTTALEMEALGGEGLRPFDPFRVMANPEVLWA